MNGEKWVITMELNTRGEVNYDLTHVVGFAQTLVNQGSGTFGDVAYECEKVITGFKGWEHI